MNWVDRLRTSADKRMWSRRRAVVMVWWAAVVVALRLSVIPRGRAIGLLATKGNPLPDCSGQGERRSFTATSWASRAVAAAPSFQTCLRACIHFVCVCVYMCMSVSVRTCIYIYIYVHECMYMNMYAFIHTCMCMCMLDTLRHCYQDFLSVHTCAYVCLCICVCMWAHFVYLYCPISLLHARVSQMFHNTCMRGCGRIGSGVFFNLLMVSACWWCWRMYFVRGKDRGFVLYVSLCLMVLGWCVCVRSYTRVHSPKLLVYLMWTQVWDRHLESQKNTDQLKSGIHVDRIGVQSTFVHIYMLCCGFW